MFVPTLSWGATHHCRTFFHNIIYFLPLPCFNIVYVHVLCLASPYCPNQMSTEAVAKLREERKFRFFQKSSRYTYTYTKTQTLHQLLVSYIHSHHFDECCF
jgi:hypothetical protein